MDMGLKKYGLDMENATTLYILVQNYISVGFHPLYPYKKTFQDVQVC